MTDEIFVLTLALIRGLILWWGFKHLPEERWQILAAVPVKREKNNGWSGVNLTYYGFFTANAVLTSTAVFIILMASLPACADLSACIAQAGTADRGVPICAVFITGAVILIMCIPASRIIARIVEKKPHTATVGGASFVAIITMPWIVLLIDATLGERMGFDIQVITVLAAGLSSYAIGEGMGRLACISFGCCYGKPLSKSRPYLQRLFKKRNFVFSSKTKKIAYAGGLDEEKVLPIQAVTSIIYTGCGLIGIYIFLKGYYCASFLLTISVTQLWRLISELFRADYRGGGKISAYQVMSIIAILYSVFIVFIFPAPQIQTPNLMAGLRSLWDPAMIISLQCLWVTTFLFSGRSNVTRAAMSFHVIDEKI
jgi:Prolipoprotein diacylglyceryl transferase.